MPGRVTWSGEPARSSTSAHPGPGTTTRSADPDLLGASSRGFETTACSRTAGFRKLDRDRPLRDTQRLHGPTMHEHAGRLPELVDSGAMLRISDGAILDGMSHDRVRRCRSRAHRSLQASAFS